MGRIYKHPSWIYVPLMTIMLIPYWKIQVRSKTKKILIGDFNINPLSFDTLKHIYEVIHNIT